jgi:hypothetical protein
MSIPLPADHIVVKDEPRCVQYIFNHDGWWHAAVSFDGKYKYIGGLGSDRQAARVTKRWRDALMGEEVLKTVRPQDVRQRGQRRKPRAT